MQVKRHESLLRKSVNCSVEEAVGRGGGTPPSADYVFTGSAAETNLHYCFISTSTGSGRQIG
ncbi:hypothetical protein J6590_063776 [Homalodisca vitripennis]|nr:hypothetical protein J6590_063776 [Homalodisca vitripennis]